MLRKKYNKKLKKTMYALVSKSKPGKVLQWYGKKKPSAGAVEKTEARVQYFKHHGG